jgi:hypothetical protein
MLSLKHNFLFIHTSKTGGNSIQSALLPYSEDYLEDLPHSHKSKDFEVKNNQFPKLTKHATLYDYRQCLGTELLQQLFKFGCVRNPWERVISFYFSPHRGGQPWSKKEFMKMLNQESIPPAIEMFSTQAFEAKKTLTNDLDFVIRFENLVDDFKKVCAKIGLSFIELPHKNKSKCDDYTAYYDEEMLSLVEARYADDIKVFGYKRPF